MSHSNKVFNGNSGADENEEIRIDVPWGHIAGKWWGSRTIQPVLALHGWQDNAGTFDTLCPLLIDKNTSILCIELPGHGLSSHYYSGHYYSIWDGVLTLRRIVKHFGWTNIQMLGHSLGAAIAFLYAAIFPKEVDNYIAIDMISPVPKDTEDIVDQLQSTIDKFLRFDSFNLEDSTMYEYNDLLQLYMTAYSGSLTTRSAEMLLKRGAKQVTKNENHFQINRDPRLKGDGALANLTLDQILTFSSRIRCDVLSIMANSGIMLHKPLEYDSIVEKIRQSARSFEMHTVDGTHHVHLNNPEKIYSIIKSYWKTCS